MSGAFKNGSPSTHPLTGRELPALRRNQRESAKSPFVFVSDAISRDEIPREQEWVWAFDRYVILPLTIEELVEN